MFAVLDQRVRRAAACACQSKPAPRFLHPTPRIRVQGPVRLGRALIENAVVEIVRPCVRRGRRTRPCVLERQRGVQVAQYLTLVRIVGPVDIPTIAIGAPAIHVDAPKDRLSLRNGDRAVVAVDLCINLLHPTGLVMRRRILRMAALPVVQPVGLRRVQGQVVEVRRYAVLDPVLVDIETPVQILAAYVDLFGAVDIVIRVAPRADVDCYTIKPAGTLDRGEHLVHVVNPAQGIAVVGVSVDCARAERPTPRRDCLTDHLMRRPDRLNRIVALAEAIGIVGRGYVCFVAAGGRPFDSKVGLVPDEPDLAARGGLNEVRTPLGEVRVVGRQGNSALAGVAVVEPADDCMPLVCEPGEIHAAHIAGVVPDRYRSRNPAARNDGLDVV